MKKTMNNYQIEDDVKDFEKDIYKILKEGNFIEILREIVICRNNLEEKYPDKRKTISQLGLIIFNPNVNPKDPEIEKLIKKDEGSGE